MMDKKELKEVTYSSEYVDKLERKLEQARKKNVRLEYEKRLVVLHFILRYINRL